MEAVGIVVLVALLLAITALGKSFQSGPRFIEGRPLRYRRGMPPKETPAPTPFEEEQHD